MKGMSVTQRAKAVKQPRGGYIPLRMMEKTEYYDGKVLGEENVSPSVVGLAVDYLTRMELTGDREKAFEISMYGATRLGRKKEGLGYLEGITGLDDGSVRNACRLVWFDTFVRSGQIIGDPMDNNADENTCENIRTMVERTTSFFEKAGPVMMVCPTFLGGYSDTVVLGDGDLATKDTLWDIKTSKNSPKSTDTLQMAMYWIMGRRSVHPELIGLDSIGIYNPRLNMSYTLDMRAVSRETIEAIERDVICYRSC